MLHPEVDLISNRRTGGLALNVSEFRGVIPAQIESASDLPGDCGQAAGHHWADVAELADAPDSKYCLFSTTYDEPIGLTRTY
jgi:hypothetical protein